MGVVTGTNAPGELGSRLRSPACTAWVSIFMLLPLPARPFFCIFQDNAGVKQLLADLVATGEVAILLCLRALGDETFHLSVAHGIVRSRRAQDVEDTVKLIQQL